MRGRRDMRSSLLEVLLCQVEDSLELEPEPRGPGVTCLIVHRLATKRMVIMALG
jgi:hypothetical protein